MKKFWAIWERKSDFEPNQNIIVNTNIDRAPSLCSFCSKQFMDISSINPHREL